MKPSWQVSLFLSLSLPHPQKEGPAVLIYTGWLEIGWCQLASCHANLVIAVKIKIMGASWNKNCPARPMVLVWKLKKFIFHFPFICRSFSIWSTLFPLIGPFLLGKKHSFEWAQKQRNRTTAWCDLSKFVHANARPIWQFLNCCNSLVFPWILFKI